MKLEATKGHDLGTSADWTRGYRSALAHVNEPLREYTRGEREMFMRGYKTGMEDGAPKQA